MKVGSACACATTEKALCSPSFSQKEFCCYESMPAARCYSGSRDQVEIDQKREYISVNGKAAFSSLQTMAVSQHVTDLLR